MSSIRDRVRLMPASNLDAMQQTATDAIEDLRTAYLAVSHSNIDQLLQMIEAPAPHDEAWQSLVYRIAHDLKGQGSTFGHELVTKIAASLCTLIRKSGTCEDPSFAKRANAHCEALRVVLDKDIRGNGGENGLTLLKILSSEE